MKRSRASAYLGCKAERSAPPIRRSVSRGRARLRVAHLFDEPAAKRIAARSGEKPLFDGPVVNGPQGAHVEYDGIGPETPRQKPPLVMFEPFGGELFRRQLASAHIPDEHTVGHPVVCGRTVPPRPFALPDVARETGDKIREGFGCGSRPQIRPAPCKQGRTCRLNLVSAS